MRNFTLLLALFASFIITAQDHPKKRPELLLGKEVTIKELSEYKQKEGYTNFYTNEALLKVYEKGYMNTKYEALVGKTFKVLSVDPITDIIGQPGHSIKLQGEDGTILYHEYDTNYYYFIVKGGLDYPADFFCDFIKEEPFLDTGMTDYIISPSSAIALIKRKGTKITGYTLVVTSFGASLDTATGVTLHFDNGAKITRPSVKPSIDVTSIGTYTYRASVLLTDKEFELVKNNAIVEYKVGPYQETMDSNEWAEIKNALPCLLSK